MSDDLDDLFNVAALKKVLDPAGTPSVASYDNPGKQRLANETICSAPDVLGMRMAMLAAEASLHREVHVGAIAYNRLTGEFGGPGCNGLNRAGRAAGQFNPYLMHTGPLDKHFTECAEIRAINAAKFLAIDTTRIVRSEFIPATRKELEAYYKKPYWQLTPEQVTAYSHQFGVRRTFSDKSWNLYTTRLPCKRCRPYVGSAGPFEVITHLQTTEELLKSKKGYADDVAETIEYFRRWDVKIRFLDLPMEYKARLDYEATKYGFPFGVPKRRPSRGRAARHQFGAAKADAKS